MGKMVLEKKIKQDTKIYKGMRDSWRLEQGVEKLFYIHQKQNKVTISNIKKYAKGWETVKDWNIHQKQNNKVTYQERK